MTDVSDFIEEELGIDVLPWQRSLIDKMFPPPPPYVPPKVSWRVHARRWFNRVVLRRKPKPIDISQFDAMLKNIYGPAIREHLNMHNTIMEKIKTGDGRARWGVHGEHLKARLDFVRPLIPMQDEFHEWDDGVKGGEG